MFGNSHNPALKCVQNTWKSIQNILVYSHFLLISVMIAIFQIQTEKKILGKLLKEVSLLMLCKFMLPFSLLHQATKLKSIKFIKNIRITD